MRLTDIETVLANMANRLTEQRTAIQNGLGQIESASSVLAGMPTSFAADIATIDAFDGTNAYQASMKAKMHLILDEAASLKAQVDAGILAAGV